MVRALAPMAMRLALPSADAAAQSVLYAATAAPPGSYTGPQKLGESRGPVGPAAMSKAAQDPALARALWERSEELTGIRFAF